MLWESIGAAVAVAFGVVMAHKVGALPGILAMLTAGF